MGIRIIAGKLKKREIKGIPKDKELRPILSRIKKSLFDIIRPKIIGAKFLDLYAGTGSVGIEAVSRGADLVIFVEVDEKLVKILKKNLERFKIENQTEVYQRDILLGLEWLKDFKGEKFFDIIFMGPPYKEKIVSRTLELISDAGILKEKGIIIAQHHIKEKVETDKFNLFRTEKYGDSILSFFENKNVAM